MSNLKDLSFWERLMLIKQELKVSKGIRNTYGSFNYRSKEQIMEALKPLEEKYLVYVSTNNPNIEVIEGRLFVVGVAEARDMLDGEVKFERTSRAELQPVHSVKMNESQLTGSAESYAAKRALEAMFGLDNTKDADDEDLVRTDNIKTITAKKPEGLTKQQEETIQPVGSKKIIGKVKASNIVDQNPNESNEIAEDEVKNQLHKLGQESLKATSAEDIRRLEDKLKELGGDDIVEKVISGRARLIGLVKNLKTNEWEKRI